ncbi:MAG TPA: TetR/AcrR family transcriptional regulator [Kofleriaceae bacterium]|jgi:AcrR family transcriptional regulator
MARTVGADKAVTHERIVRAAAKAIRREGYDGTRVADVMKDAGLTHGGFYAHFKDREAMLVEALDFTAGETVATLIGQAQVNAAADDITPLEAMVDQYLSDSHLKTREAGCTIAALGSETRRQSPEIRRVATKHLKELAATISREIDPAKKRSRDAISSEGLAALSTLVGALVIARIVDDPALADDVRAAAKIAVVG